jgi:hypothetical protein
MVQKGLLLIIINISVPLLVCFPAHIVIPVPLIEREESIKNNDFGTSSIWIPVGVYPFWIPAFAGMTGRGRNDRKGQE